MKQKIIASIIVLVAIIGVGGYFVYSSTLNASNKSQNKSSVYSVSQKDIKAPTNQTAPLLESSPEMLDFKGSFEDLLARGGSVQCIWSGEVSGSQVNATAFIKDGKIAMEGKMTTKGVASNVFLVGNKDSVTGWMVVPVIGQKLGYKINLSELKKYADSSDQVKKQAYEQAKKSYSYKCSEWNYDESKFKIPSDIKFYN